MGVLREMVSDGLIAGGGVVGTVGNLVVPDAAIFVGLGMVGVGIAIAPDSTASRLITAVFRNFEIDSPLSQQSRRRGRGNNSST